MACTVASLIVFSGGQAIAAPKDDLDAILKNVGVNAPTGVLEVSESTVDADGTVIRIMGAKPGKGHGARRTWSTNGVTHVAQRLSEDTTQLLSVLESPSSPKRIAYDFPGKELQLLPDGSVAVVDPAGAGTLVAHVKKPWATDADGTAVRTHYVVNGSSLTQVVKTSGNTAYPVVADPTTVKRWYGWDVRFNRSETTRIAAGGGACAFVVSKAPVVGPNLATICGAMAAWALSATAMNKCVAVKVVNRPRAAAPWYWGC